VSHLELTSLILTILVRDEALTARELCATSGCTRAELALALGSLIEGGAVVTSGLGRGTRYCLAIDDSIEQAVVNAAREYRAAADSRAEVSASSPLSAALDAAADRAYTAWSDAVRASASDAPTALDLLDAARAARTDYERAANGVGFQWGPIADAMELSADGLEAIIAGRVATALPAGYILTPGMVQSHRDRATDARGRATVQAAYSGIDRTTGAPLLSGVVLAAGPCSTGDLMRDLEQTAERLAGGATLGQLSARGVA